MTLSVFDVTRLVTDVFDQLHIPYLVGGSMASTMYGLVRTTQDVDIVADVHLRHVDKLVELLGDTFYMAPEAAAEAIRRRASFNLLHLVSMFKVDVFVVKNRPYDHAQFENRVLQPLNPTSAHLTYVASAEDTILTKLEWYRLGDEVSERQWKDILGVLAVQQGRLDENYLKKWAVELKVGDLLVKAQHEAQTRSME